MFDPRSLVVSAMAPVSASKSNNEMATLDSAVMDTRQEIAALRSEVNSLRETMKTLEEQLNRLKEALGA